MVRSRQAGVLNAPETSGGKRGAERLDESLQTICTGNAPPSPPSRAARPHPLPNAT